MNVPAIGDPTSAGKGERGGQPEWRWNEKAPWRVQPGQPPLFDQGESLSALGIDRAERIPDWIPRRSQVNSVAFSPDGHTLASGSEDGSVRLWGREGQPEGGMTGGQRGDWLSWTPKRLWRGDDGTLLHHRMPTGLGDPVTPTEMEPTGAPELTLVPIHETVTPSSPLDLGIRVSNPGQVPLYQLQLESSFSSDGVLCFEPGSAPAPGNPLADRLPRRLARLDPGEMRELGGRIAASLDLPAAPGGSGKRSLTLRLRSANAPTVEKTLEVMLQMPEPRWQNALWDPEAQILRTALANAGAAPLSPLRIAAEWRPDASAAKAEFRTPWQELPELAPGAQTELAFVLPDGDRYLDGGDLRLHGIGNALPLFEWRPSPPEIEGIVRFTYWLLLPLLAAVLAGLYYLRRYRHPLVLRLSAEPATLLALPLGQVPEARERLRLTGRLETVLAAAGVSAPTLERGTDFFRRPAAEQAGWLARRLGGEFEPVAVPDDVPPCFLLRSLSEEGHCAFVLAGFWYLYRHAVLDYQSPLKNFGELVEIGALEEGACRELVSEPMHSLRLVYADAALPAEILEQTGRRANLIGIACHEIIAALDSSQRRIGTADVQAALRGGKLRNALKGWDATTEDAAANRLDRLVVYATVAQGRFRRPELVARLDALGIRVDSHDVCYYPDVFLVCDPENTDKFLKRHPCLILEVLSPSTDATDRREKWSAYRNIPELRYYLLAASDARRLEYYARDESGAWKTAQLDEGEVLRVACPDYRCDLTLAQVYEDLGFPASGAG